MVVAILKKFVVIGILVEFTMIFFLNSGLFDNLLFILTLRLKFANFEVMMKHPLI